MLSAYPAQCQLVRQQFASFKLSTTNRRLCLQQTFVLLPPLPNSLLHLENWIFDSSLHESFLILSCSISSRTQFLETHIHGIVLRIVSLSTMGYSAEVSMASSHLFFNELYFLPICNRFWKVGGSFWCTLFARPPERWGGSFLGSMDGFQEGEAVGWSHFSLLFIVRLDYFGPWSLFALRYILAMWWDFRSLS